MYLKTIQWQLVVLSLLYLAASMLNNIGVQQMGYYMPIYSTFLLYGPTAAYTFIFFCIAVVLGELRDGWSKIRQHWMMVLSLGVLTALNGIFAQIAIPFVDPEITAMVTQISTPVTWIFSPILIRDGKNLPTVIKVVGFFLILYGMLFGGLFSYFHGSGSSDNFKNSYWILVAVMSALPTSFETIFQEKAYRVHKMPIFLTLTLYNLVSFLPYFLWMFTTTTTVFGTCVNGAPDLGDCPNEVRACAVSEIWDQQKDSFLCFFGEYSTTCCDPLSTLWVSVFTLGYVASFGVASYLLMYPDGSNLVANLGALASPLTSAFFWLPRVITGPSYTHFKWWVLVAFLAMLIGNVLYVNFGDFKARWNIVLTPCLQKDLYEEEEDAGDAIIYESDLERQPLKSKIMQPILPVSPPVRKGNTTIQTVP